MCFRTVIASFFVRAVQCTCVGVHLFHLFPKLFVAAPTGSPQGVRASPISSSSVRVYWSPPQLHLQNGPLTGYKISCSPSPSGSRASASASSNSSSAMVTGLAAYTQYSCKVAARSRNGDGPYSRPSVVVTAEAGMSSLRGIGSGCAFMSYCKCIL